MRKNMWARTRSASRCRMGRTSSSLLRQRKNRRRRRGLVAQNHVIAAQGVCGQAGAQRVDAVEGGLGGDAVFVAGKAEGLVGDLESEVLGHLKWLITLPTRSAILSLPRSGRRPAGGGGEVAQFFFGGRQQVVAFAGALVGQGGIVAAHQPLPRVIGVGDFEQVLLIEQRQLQRPGLHQGFDLRGAQRADPIQVAGRSSSRMRALVSMPRSPPNTPATARTGS